MIMLVALSEWATAFSVAPLTTGATTLACSFGCLQQGKYFVIDKKLLVYFFGFYFTWDVPQKFVEFQIYFCPLAAVGCASSWWRRP